MIKAEDIKGYKELSEISQKLVIQFWHEFNIAHEKETREHIKPICVKACCEIGCGEYLRFDYTYFEDKRWVHVKGHPIIWF
jgi:hypothetical protein